MKDEKILKESLVKLTSDKDLAILDNRLRREVNIFDILKIADAEIRHSNILAWLLDPNQNHGLGDAFLKDLFRQITGKNAERGFDFSELNIFRERSHTDILLEYDYRGKKFVICIENKIHAGEGKDQLKHYKDAVDKDYPDSEGWQKYFVFLTLDGHESSHPENWQSLDYEFIINSLRHLLREHEFDLNRHSEMIIKQYLTILERQVYGMDKETTQLLTKLKKQYPNAIQAIVERFSDDNLTNATSDAIKELLQRRASDFPHLHVVEDKTTKSLIRCRTDAMDEFFPDGEVSGGWGDGHKYFYEIGCHKDGKVTVKLVFSLDAFEGDKRGRELAEKLREIGTTNSKREITDERQWLTAHVILKKTQYLKGNSDGGEGVRTEIVEGAEDKLCHALAVEILKFEQEIKASLA